MQALYLTKDGVLASDLESETWEKVVNNFHKYNDQETPRAWLSRVMRNLWVDQCRKKVKGRTGDRSVFADSYSANNQIPLDHIGALGEAYELEDEDAVINAALVEIIKSHLSAEQRRVILHRAKTNDMAFKEIADLENASINTVIGRMRYGRNKILLNLGKYLPPEKVSYIVHAFPKVKRFMERRGPEYRALVFKN